MKKLPIAFAALMAATMLSVPAFSQTATPDPQCIIKNADGTEQVDMTKCPDGLKPADAGQPGAATDPGANKTDSAQTPAPGTATDPAAGTAAQNAPDTAADPSTIGSITAPADLIVPPTALSGATIVSASDFIGKRVYSQAGEDIGEVNDVIFSESGDVRAVVLGVGGFLGMGEKDVAVAMNAINVTTDAAGERLTVAASKDQLSAAPTYDRTTRTYQQ